MFHKLYNLIKNDIEKQETYLREAISAKHRLIITLRLLATGESFRSLRYTFRIGQSTISNIIPEVCETIYKNLKDIYLKVFCLIIIFVMFYIYFFVQYFYF